MTMKITSSLVVTNAVLVTLLALATGGCQKPTCESCAAVCPTCSGGKAGAPSGGGGNAGVSGGGAGGADGGTASSGGRDPGAPQGIPYGPCETPAIDCTNAKLQAAGFDIACLQTGTSCVGTMCYAYLRSGGQCNKVGATNACKKSNGTNGTVPCAVNGAACGWGTCN
jgi:hypothetical protein